MKLLIASSLDTFRHDRVLLGLSIGILFLILIYVLYVAFSLSPTELQIATRYTAFGETQYYRTQWFYLMTFIGFGVVIAVSHIAILIKLKIRDLRNMAIGFGIMTIVLLLVLIAITRSVLGIAYLS